MHQDSEAVAKAREYLGGKSFPYAELKELWKTLKEELELGYARNVLALLREGAQLSGDQRPGRKDREKMTQQHALCTSKDPDLSAAERHDAALLILEDLALDEPDPYGGQETLGIAGGICKRKWEAFGQAEDLKQSLRYYERGYRLGVTEGYGYTAINTAFVLDLLVELGELPEEERERAQAIRREILEQVAPLAETENDKWLKKEWWFFVTLAEACLGLGEFDEAVAWVKTAKALPDTPLWEFETTARQFVALASLLPQHDMAATKRVIETLVADRAANVDDVIVGKVGLALSGGGFRASLYHLGVLARLAELDVLRHVEVLSCVSGGSIVGAHYYLALRQLLQSKAGEELSSSDYVGLVADLIESFKAGVAADVLVDEPTGLGGKIRLAWRALRDKQQGLFQSEWVADGLEAAFYRSYADDIDPLYLDRIEVTPKGHDESQLGRFHPRRHNWQRAHKVPALVINATTVNTGHCWQFTTRSMGETPYALHQEVDSVPRLRRSWYNNRRRERLGRAVAASAAVPGVFDPLRLEGLYPADGKPYDVRLVDGGVFDNQGLVGLLATDCNVVLVSDAAGQLMEENHPPEGRLRALGAYGARAVLMLMERIRQSGYSQLKTRLQTRKLRGLMFIHMKDGLHAEPVSWAGCQEAYQPPRQNPLTPSGVRRDFQQRLAELRTHLDDFTYEADYLLACGYQMAAAGFQDTLAALPGLGTDNGRSDWVFDEALELICSTDEELLDRQQQVLERLAGGTEPPED